MLAVSVHPGVIASGLLPLYSRIGAPIAEGAETVARLCLPTTSVRDGAYYDGAAEAPVAALANDERAVARLWKATAKVVGFDRLPLPVAA